jgi:hypothetical protein
VHNLIVLNNCRREALTSTAEPPQRQALRQKRCDERIQTYALHSSSGHKPGVEAFGDALPPLSA